MGCNTSKIGPNPVPVSDQPVNKAVHQTEEKESDQPLDQSNVTQSVHPALVTTDQPLRSILKSSGGTKKDWDAIRAKKGLSSTATNTQILSTNGSADQQQTQTMFSNTVTVAQAQEQSSNGHVDDHLKQPLQQKHARIRSSSSTLRNRAYVEVIDIRHERAPSQTPSANNNQHSPKHMNSIHTENQSINQSANTFTSASSLKPIQKKKKRRTSHKGLMSRLALQFPVIRRSLVAVYTAYQQFIDNHHSQSIPAAFNMQSVSQSANQTIPALATISHIDTNQLKGVLEHLTNRSRTFSEDQVNELFELAHLRRNGDAENAKLSFRECLIAIAIGYYLSDHPEPSASEDPNFATIAQGFKVIRQAFIDMDDDDSGKLDKNELKQALFAASSMNSKNSLLEDRFAELDFNSDGDVELKEFIYGVVSWVNLTSDEEQEDMEQST